MSYFLHLILELIAIVVAVFTNPIVCLFADEYGQLPWLLKWWQTYDNPLDIDWMVYEDGCTWKIFRYDFNRHYCYHPEDKSTNVTFPGYVDLLDCNFTTKEKIQRYFCRLTWLYRNSNYGFSYYVNGRDVNLDNMTTGININELNNREWLSFDSSYGIWDRPWSYFYDRQYCKWFRLRLYFGWKCKGLTQGTERCMIAISINPFKGLDKGDGDNC